MGGRPSYCHPSPARPTLDRNLDRPGKPGRVVRPRRGRRRRRAAPPDQFRWSRGPGQGAALPDPLENAAPARTLGGRGARAIPHLLLGLLRPLAARELRGRLGGGARRLGPWATSRRSGSLSA
eukprot:5606903-Pyramimonas_sp.AAC.1